MKPELLALILVMDAFADISGSLDAYMAKAQIKITHGPRWLARTAFALLCVYMGHFNWLALLLCAATFSMMFRFAYNRSYGNKLDYISSSNIYDSIFLKVFGKNGGKAAYLVEAIVLVACFIVLNKR